MNADNTPSLQSFIVKPLLNLLGNGRLSILIYHRVLESSDPLFPSTVDVDRFRWQMELLADHFNVLPLTTAVRLLRNNQLPKRALCITFDDGYADNVEVALPVLREYGLTATFFIATGFLDGGRMWNDTVIETIRNLPDQPVDLRDLELGEYDLATIAGKRICIESILNKIKHHPQARRQELADELGKRSPGPLPVNLMMRGDQVRALHAAGMEIGGHTITHPILATLDLADVKREIAGGKEVLEGIIGDKLTLFAYPNGKPGSDYLAEHVEVVRDAGFEAAVSTMAGVSSGQTGLYELRRFTPWDTTPNRFLLRLARNYLMR